MNIRESIEIVNLLHAAYPQDKRATREDLLQRAESYSVALADTDVELVKKAAQYHIRTSKWHPTTKELLDAVSRVRLSEVPTVTPVKTVRPTVDEARLDEYLDAFCEWIGFGEEANDSKELPKGVIKYEN